MATLPLKIMYHPEGGSPREWVIDLINPAWDLTYGIEKATEMPWGVFRDRLQQESAIALQALLWVLRKRDEPRLTLESVRPSMGEVDYAAECPTCREWVSTADDVEHDCPPPEDEAEPEAAPDPEA